MMKLGLFCVLGLSMLSAGCGIPDGGIVIGLRMIEGAGLVNESPQYEGLYLRSTTNPNRLAQTGGSPKHFHGYSHTIEDFTGFPDSIFGPFGVEKVAPSATHRHGFRTTNQEPTITDEVDNGVSYINVGIFAKRKTGSRVPKGTVVGFLGDKVPDGWALLDGSNGLPNVNGLVMRIGSVEKWGKTEILDPLHTHRIQHTHEVTILQNDPTQGSNMQTYETRTEGTINVSSPTHGHIVTGLVQVKGEVQPVALYVPKMQVVFIMAMKNKRSLPLGTLIMTNKVKIPGGWVNVSTTYDPYFPNSPVGESFLGANSRPGVMEVFTPPIDHRHSFEELFRGTLSPPVGTSEDKTIKGGAPEVAAAGHPHSLSIEYKEQTERAVHLPPYLELYFILKVR